MGTKKDFIDFLTNVLKDNPNEEYYLTPYLQNKLRNGRWGYHAYCLCYYNDGLYARPWSGADMYWKVNLMKLRKAELRDLIKR